VKEITPEGFQRAAKELGVEVAVIKTVAEVESAGSGFTEDGNVRILFERHKFHHFTGGDYDQTHPDISNPKAGGYGPGGKHQYERFSEAFALDPDAAMKSASWGKFQIMGFNFKAAGFDSVGEFVDAMKTGEDAQLAAFVKVIKSWGLKDELRNHNWASFAKQYNGADYKINRYDEKLARAYEKFKHEPVATEPAVTTRPPDDAKSGEPVPDAPAKQGEAVVGGRPEDPAKQVTRGGTPTRWAVGSGILSAIGSAVWAYLKNNSNVVVVAIVCITLLILVFVFRQIILDWARLQLGASPDKYNVK